MSPWRRSASPDNPLPKGHPFRFQASLASATGQVVLRHVGAKSGLGADRPPVELTARGQWVAVGSALCFAGDRDLASGVIRVGELLWAEWPWIERLEVDGCHLQVRFRTGRERSPGEYREAELMADDEAAATLLAQVCRRGLEHRPPSG